MGCPSRSVLKTPGAGIDLLAQAQAIMSPAGREGRLNQIPQQIRCPYCSEFFPKNEMTDDHVIASTWYPANVPASFQRYTVPACRLCNERLGKIEEDILHHLAGCLDPQNSAVEPIVEKLKRAIDPSAAGSDADRQKREARRRSLQNDMVDASDVPRHKFAAWTLPNIRDGQPSRAIRVPTTLAHVVEKWVRGIYYKTTKSFLPDAYTVQSVPVTDKAEADIFEFIKRRGKVLAKGPGIAVTQWIEHQNEVLYAIYSFTIWDVFSVYAAAAPIDKPIREMQITAEDDVVII
jgi:hypothetical protein